MFTGMKAVLTLMVIACAGEMLCQDKPQATGTPTFLEFPVTMKQKVEAGKTPIGTKIKVELVMATLVDGKTVPRGAVLSGVVTESAVKTAATPSLLAIRLDSAQWKKGSVAIKAYLTPWFYPIRNEIAPDLRYGPADGPISKTWNGMGTYPGSAASQPFPDTTVTDPEHSAPDTPATNISNRRSVMKDVEAMRDQYGAIAISSRRLNLKLDKLTTYVFVTSAEAGKN